MSNLDRFESAFRATVREQFVYLQPHFPKVLMVTDAKANDLATFDTSARQFLTVLDADDPDDRARFSTLPPSDLRNMQTMLTEIEEREPSLIVTHRGLDAKSPDLPYSLGEHIDVLTQVTHPPVLLLPHPSLGAGAIPKDTDRVMAMTDHLAGDGVLVNTAARFCQDGGKLLLSHVEDGASFDRFLDAVSKVPDLDTEIARKDILKRLLKEPQDFAEQASEVIGQGRTGENAITVEALVSVGHRLSEYRRLVEDHKVDLLVLHTKDKQQLAMHGTAHSLAVELGTTPLLLL